MQGLIERNVGAVLAPVEGDDRLRRARVRIGTAPGWLALRWLARVPGGHAYELELTFEASPDLSPDTADSLERQAPSWLQVWMHGLGAEPDAPAAATGTARDGPVPRRAAGSRIEAGVEAGDEAGVESALDDVLRAWRAAEQPWTDARTTQQAIVQALRAGGCFTTSHKEGATTIRHDGGGFVRVDEGESPGTRRFVTEAGLLRHLRTLYDHDITRHAGPAGVSDADTWRLIHRQLDAGVAAQGPARRSAGRLNLPVLLTVVIGCGVAAVLGYLRWHPRAEALRAASTPPRVDRVVPPPVGAASAADWQGLQQRHLQAVEAAKAAARAASR